MSQLHMWHGYGEGRLVAVGIPAPTPWVEMIRDWWQLFTPAVFLAVEELAY